MAVHYIATPQIQHAHQQPTPETALRRSRRHLTSATTEVATLTQSPTPSRKRPRVIEIQEEEESATSLAATAASTPRSSKARSRAAVSLAPPTPEPTPRAIRAQKRRKLVDEGAPPSSAAQPVPSSSISPPSSIPNSLTMLEPIPNPPASISPESHTPATPQQYSFKTRAGKRKALAITSTPTTSSPTRTNINAYEDEGTSGSGSDSSSNVKGDMRPRALRGMKRRRVVRVTTPPTHHPIDDNTDFGMATRRSSLRGNGLNLCSEPAPTLVKAPIKSSKHTRSTSPVPAKPSSPPTPSHPSRDMNVNTPTTHPSKLQTPLRKTPRGLNASKGKSTRADANEDAVDGSKVKAGKPSRNGRSVFKHVRRRSARLSGDVSEEQKVDEIGTDAADSRSGVTPTSTEGKRRASDFSKDMEIDSDEPTLCPSSTSADELESTTTTTTIQDRDLASVITASSSDSHPAVEATSASTSTSESLSSPAALVDANPTVTHSSVSSSLTPPPPPPSPPSSPNSLSPIKHPRPPPNPFAYLHAQHLAHVRTRPSNPSPLGMFVWKPGPGSASGSEPGSPRVGPFSPVGSPVPLPVGSLSLPTSITMTMPLQGGQSSPTVYGGVGVGIDSMSIGIGIGVGQEGFWQQPQMQMQVPVQGGQSMQPEQNQTQFGGQTQMQGWQQPQQTQQSLFYPQQQQLQVQDYQGQPQMQPMGSMTFQSQPQMQQSFENGAYSQQGYTQQPQQGQLSQPMSMQMQIQQTTTMSMTIPLSYNAASVSGSDQIQFATSGSPQQQQSSQNGSFMLDPSFNNSTGSWDGSSSNMSSNSTDFSMQMPIQLPRTVNLQDLTLPPSTSSNQSQQDGMQWYYPQQQQAGFVEAGQSQQTQLSGFGENQQTQQLGFGQQSGQVPEVGFGSPASTSDMGFGRDAGQPQVQESSTSTNYDQSSQQQQSQSQPAVDQVFQRGYTPEGVGVEVVTPTLEMGVQMRFGTSTSGSGSEGDVRREEGHPFRNDASAPSSSSLGSSQPHLVPSSPSNHLQVPSSPSHAHPSHASSHPHSLPHAQPSTHPLPYIHALQTTQPPNYPLPLQNALHSLQSALSRFHEEQEVMRQHASLVLRRQLEDFEREREWRRGGKRGVDEDNEMDDADECDAHMQTVDDKLRERDGSPPARGGNGKKNKGPKRCDVSVYSAHKSRELWIVACKSRMYEFARRYSAPLIRDFTECVAREYHVRKGLKFPGSGSASRRRLAPSSSSSLNLHTGFEYEYTSDEDVEGLDDLDLADDADLDLDLDGDVGLDDGEEFRKEQVFDFELSDDDDDEYDDVEEKENAQVEDEPDLDPSFNPELTKSVKAQSMDDTKDSLPTPPWKSGRAASMSTFYVPPLQVRIGQDVDNGVDSEPDPASIERPSSPTPDSPVSPDSPDSPTMSPSSPPSPSPKYKITYIQNPILPLPPPKLSVVRPLALKMYNSEPDLDDLSSGGSGFPSAVAKKARTRYRGTPSIRSRREAWAMDGCMLPWLGSRCESEQVVLERVEGGGGGMAFAQADFGGSEEGSDVETASDATVVGDDAEMMDVGSDLSSEKTADDVRLPSPDQSIPEPSPSSPPTPTIVLESRAIDGAILSSTSSSATPSEGAPPVDDTAVVVDVVEPSSVTPHGFVSEKVLGKRKAQEDLDQVELDSRLPSPIAPSHQHQLTNASRNESQSLLLAQPMPQSGSSTLHLNTQNIHTINTRTPSRRRVVLGRDHLVLRVYAPPTRSAPHVLPLARRPPPTPPLDVSATADGEGVGLGGNVAFSNMYGCYPVVPYSWEGVADAWEVVRYLGGATGWDGASAATGLGLMGRIGPGASVAGTGISSLPSPMLNSGLGSNVGMGLSGDVPTMFNPSSSELSSALG